LVRPQLWTSSAPLAVAAKIRAALCVLVAAIVAVTFGLSCLKPAAPGVARSTVLTGHVKRGQMLRQVRGIGTLVARDAGGATVCMATHDPRYAKYADRTFHLFDGQAVEEDRHQKAAEESGFNL